MTVRRPDERRTCAAGLLLLVASLAGCSFSSYQLLSQAEASWRKGHYEEAIQANKALYMRERNNRYGARALLNLGNIYYLNLRDVRGAIEFYDKLTREFPDAPETIDGRRQLAAIYANEVIDLDQAIAQYDKLLEVKNLQNRAEIVFQRADAYFKKEDYDRALRELHGLEEAGISGHMADQVSLKIGNIYQVRKQFESAVEPFRKVLAAECPECRRRAVLNLTDTYENLFEFDKAIETIQKLDRTEDNEAFIRREVDRLNNRRKAVEKGILPQQPLPNDTPKPAGVRRRIPKKTEQTTRTSKTVQGDIHIADRALHNPSSAI